MALAIAACATEGNDDGADQASASSEAATAIGTRLQNAHSGLCLGIAGSSAGSAVIQAFCDITLTNRGEQWVNHSDSNSPLIVFQNVQTTLCIAVQGGSQSAGAPAVQIPCDLTFRDHARAFNVLAYAEENEMKNGHSGLCLAVRDQSNGSPLVQAGCNASHAEQWIPLDL